MKITEIYSVFISDDKSQSIIDLFCNNKAEKLTLVSLGITISSGLFLFIFDGTRNLVGYSVIISFIIILLYSFINFFVQSKYLINASKHYVEDMITRVNKESTVLYRLSTYDSWTLKKAKERVEFEILRLEKRVGALVGALDKLGIIPAVVGLYIAISKINEKSGFTEVPDIILAFIAGTYLAALSSVQITGKLKMMAHVIGIASELAEQRESVAAKQRSNEKLNANTNTRQFML